MAFFSILYPKCESRAETESSEQPAFFKDLNLDQIVAAVTAGRQEYRLQPFFHVSLKDIDAIHYRQEIMRDLQDNVLLGHIQSFARTMRAMREHLAQAAKLYYERQKKAWFVNAMELYCDAVQSLARDLRLVELKSRGLLAFRDYVNDYIRTERFTALLSGIRSLRAELSSIKFCLLIRDNSITVRSYESETDYSVEVAETFAKFRQGAVKDYTVKFLGWPEMNHVEAGILDLVAKLHPEVFAHLDEFCSRHTDYLDETIEVFDREVQFYAAYLEFIQRLKEAGLKFCYPEICADRKDIYSLEGFDLALASKLVQENSAVVCNDFYLKDKERIFIVSGPNQGGKTTFARAFGQMHYLASVGCPVPGAKARLFLFDGLFTHFEQEEDIARLRGKLQDDLLRICLLYTSPSPRDS